ncbi:hypothetical protein, conserved [Eimeria praecox]|uniref:Uncharacterized protein n=1 Tax=Eimeria praecox TaxID=51316 RepID=U6G0U2_9EIME|nr:hypothetical protein, conserved [Eimeria praecox]
MHGQTGIRVPSPCAAAPYGSMDAGELPWDSVDETVGEWSDQANASPAPGSAKRSFWRLDRSGKLTTLLSVAATVAAYVLLRCYRQFSFVNSHVKGPLRSLAEGEEAGPELPCWGGGLEGNQASAGASDDAFELNMQQRAEGVMQRMVQVTKDCSSVAALLPPPFPMRVVDLFLGLCIQEVAALSSLLGGAFEEQKAEVLQTAVDTARDAKHVCRERSTRAQQQHASRLMQYALHMWGANPEIPPLANEVRLQMLKELLKLQETALGFIETAVSSFLKSHHSLTQITEEAAYELTEELKRIIYTRRTQVFRSKHLSHYLRDSEAKRSRGKLLSLLCGQLHPEEPDYTFEKQLDDLVSGRTWVRFPLQHTRSDLLEAYQAKEMLPAKQHESQAKQSTATKGLHASKTRSGGRHKRFHVPPRFRCRDRFSKRKKEETGAQEGLQSSDTTHREQTQQMPSGFSPSCEAQSSQVAQSLRREDQPSTIPPGQSVPELGTAFSKLALGPVGANLRRTGCPSSDRIASLSMAGSPKGAAPAAEKVLEASASRREGKMSFGVAEGAPWSPWSSAWSPHLPFSPLRVASDPDSATIYMANTLEGSSSHEAPQHLARQEGRLFSSLALPSSSVLFTTPQLIASAATEMLDTLRSQAAPAQSQNVAQYYSSPGFAASASSLLISSSLTRGLAIQPVDVPSPSEAERRSGYLHSEGQRLPERR